MRNNSFFKIILVAITVVFFASCDKDFNSIGGDLIGDEHFGLIPKSYDVLSYNQKIDPVASNNLPVNPLGIYEDAVFGTTEASFVTQVALASVNPTIGAHPKIDNVVLSIPYFSTVTAVDSKTGDSTYRLDSIYGPETGKIKLSVYESGYFMRDKDPLTGFLETQNFYTNQKSDFESLIVPPSTRLNDSINTPSQNDEFQFLAKEYKDSVYVNGVKTLVRKAPEMRLALDTTYFKNKIIAAAASGKLVTNDVFKNHFRGLYFKVEKSGASPGRLAMMDFKKGTITINYKEDLVTTTNGQSTTTRVAKSIVLNLTGNTVSLLTNTKKPAYDTALNNPNKTSGDSQLYLKGGEGAMTVLDLFDKTDVKGYDANGNETVGMNHVPDQLDELRRKDPVTGKSVMINEANLVFHVDATTMGDTKIPNRIYLYDLTNSTTVVDYLYDGSTGTNAKNGLLIYGGLLKKTTAGENFYKINITRHIRNLVKNADSTNVKLGVVVTENINNSAMNKLRSSFTLTDGTIVSKAPQASVMNPLGVVLHGGNPSVPDGKRLKLEIYYTKPN
jgi:hypothetical protein